jgi:hypothetical protein
MLKLEAEVFSAWTGDCGFDSCALRGAAFHPKFATGNCAVDLASSETTDLVELFLLGLDCDGVLEVDRAWTRPLGHSLGISTADSFVAALAFCMTLLTANA